MGLLLRRMRAHLRDPWDRAASRIAGEAEFEGCLDRAVLLAARIAELGGAAPADLDERERTRGLIMQALMAGRRVAAGAPAHSPTFAAADVAAQHWQAALAVRSLGIRASGDRAGAPPSSYPLHAARRADRGAETSSRGRPSAAKPSRHPVAAATSISAAATR